MVNLYKIIDNKYIIVNNKKRLIKNLKCDYKIFKGLFDNYIIF